MQELRGSRFLGLECNRGNNQRQNPYVGNYSTVAQLRCRGASVIGNSDLLFCFDITYRIPCLQVPVYSEYQHFLYETISDLREKKMSFNQIADHLNKKGILSVRGKKFRGAHIHSIIKKRRIRDKKLEKEYPEVRSDFRLETFDKTLINQV